MKQAFWGIVAAVLIASAGYFLGLESRPLLVQAQSAPTSAGPCAFNTRTPYVISNISSNTQVVAGVAAKKIYICAYYIAPAAAAVNVGLVEGTGSVCGSNTAGLQGGATAALNANLAINGGFIQPYTGDAWGLTATAGDSLCIFTSAAVEGFLEYVGPV